VPFRDEEFFTRSRRRQILAGGILEGCRRLKSASDTEIGENSHLWMALII
jgi:hypothetical protein